MNPAAILERAFPDTAPPRVEAVVAWDGFDLLDKQLAVECFGGRTRAQVARLVGGGPDGSAWLWGIEGLDVLEPAALRYYVKPFLRRVLTLDLEAEDDFSCFLAFCLKEALERRGAGLFTADQRRALIVLADWMIERIHGSDASAVAHRGHYARLVELLSGA